MLLAALHARRPTPDKDALARDFANDEATVVARVVAALLLRCLTTVSSSERSR
jgi:hypothetical protein